MSNKYVDEPCAKYSMRISWGGALRINNLQIRASFQALSRDLAMPMNAARVFCLERKIS